MEKTIEKTKKKAILVNAITRDSTALINLIDSLQDEELTLLTPLYLQDSNLPEKFKKNINYLYSKIEDTQDNAEDDLKTSKTEEIKISYKLDVTKNKYLENFTEVGSQGFNALMQSRETLFWGTVDYLEKALEDYDILLVLVTNEAFIHEKIFLKFAEKHKIPKLHLNHGFCLYQTSSAYATGNCDYYCTASKEDKLAQLYGAEKNNPNYEYKITGLTSLDKYYLLNNNKEKIIPKSLPKDKKIISFFTTFDNVSYVYYSGMDSYQTSLETSLKIAEKLHSDPDTFIVIKDRPTNYQFAKEKFDLLLNKYSNLDKDRIIYTFDYPEPYVLASDIVVYYNSTISIEAVLSNVLSINIDLYSSYPFTSKCHIVGMEYDGDNASDFILEMLNDPNKMQILKDLQNNEQLIGEMQDGLSNLRTAKYVSDLIGFEKTSKYIEDQINSIHEWQKANPNPSIDELLSDENPHSSYWNTINSLLKYDQRFRVSDKYAEWKNKQNSSELDGELMAQRMLNYWHNMPIFHLIYIVDASMFDALAQSLAALEHQLYKNFIISVISTDEIPAPELLELDNFNWFKSDKPFANVNQVIEQIQADWVILATAGDELNFDALFYFAEYSNLFPDWLSIYADEDKKISDIEDGTENKDKKATDETENEEKLTQSNSESKDMSSNAPGDVKKVSAIDEYYKNLQAKMPLFKPDFNLELYRSTDYIGQTVAIKTDLIKALGGFLELPYTQSTQMLFVLAEQMSVPAIGHIPKILNHKGDISNSIENNESILDLQQIIREEHIKRCGYDAQFNIIKGLKPNTYKTIFEPKQEPAVAILVDIYPSEKNRFANCLNSINEQTYKNVQVFLSIPPNLTEENKEVLNIHIEILQKKYKVHSLNRQAQLNKREILQELIDKAQDFEFWYFLQSDTEIMQDNSIEELLNHTIKPEVAMVGTRIIDTNGRIFSAGQVLGFNQDVDDIYKNFHLEQDLEALSRLWCDQNYSALSPLAILVRKSAFEEIGGFDKDFSDYYIFADLGIRMQIAGKRLHWTPYATCLSYKESSNYRANRKLQLDLWYEKWSQVLLQDPNQNYNLSLKDSGNSISNVNPSWSKYFKQLPRIVDCSLYIMQSNLTYSNIFNTIFSYMNLKEKMLYNKTNIEVEASETLKINPIEILRSNPDVIVFSGVPFYESMQRDISLIKKYYGKKLMAFIENEVDLKKWSNNFDDIDVFIIVNKQRELLKDLPEKCKYIEINIKELETNIDDTEENLKEKTDNDAEKHNILENIVDKLMNEFTI